ncbi:MAG: tRNA-dihydrouridine synthase [Candidatus Pacearchaeota archaeon]|jgi:nifR3 family TIM-barrel protein
MKKFPKLKGKAILAPMSGVSDVAFRNLCRKYGAALTYTEFVSSAAIVRKNSKTNGMLRTDKSEKPSAVQIFGSNEKEMLLAAKYLDEKFNFDTERIVSKSYNSRGAQKLKSRVFDIIDINFGCPADKIIKCGGGSELLKNPEKMGRIVNSLVKEIKKPITAKIRIGIDDKHINALEIAKIIEKNGASAICVHGRTQRQGYSGEADWKIVKKIKESVKIPVIGNGDVTSPEIFKKRLEESGVDYIMIGRAAMSNPYIFRQINDYLKTGKYDSKDKITQFFEYLELAEKYKIDFENIKNHAICFTRGIRGGGKLRNELCKCKSVEEIRKLLK